MVQVASAGHTVLSLAAVGCAWQDGSIPCNYRIAQEGLAALLPLMSAQTFRPTVDEFERIITERSVPVPSTAHPAKHAAASGGCTSLVPTQPANSPTRRLLTVFTGC